MIQQKKEVVYHSLVLRYWREARSGPDQPVVWRFVVRDVSEKQEQHVFSSFEEMVEFLRARILGEQG